MTLDDLRAFTMAYETGNLSAVARALSCTQSAVSQHIKRLERETGLALIERQPRGVAPTPAGRILYQAALGGIAPLTPRSAASASSVTATAARSASPPAASRCDTSWPTRSSPSGAGTRTSLTTTSAAHAYEFGENEMPGADERRCTGECRPSSPRRT